MPFLAKGIAWDIIKSEPERDFSSLFDDLLRLNERLNAGEMIRQVTIPLVGRDLVFRQVGARLSN